MTPEISHASIAKPLILGLLTVCTLLFLTLLPGMGDNSPAQSGDGINAFVGLGAGLSLVLIISLILGYVRTLRTLQREHHKRQTAEAALTDSETKQQAVIDSMADAAIIISDTGTVQSFNPAAESMFGYRASEVIGHNVNILMPNPHRDAHDGYLSRYRSTGQHYVNDHCELEALHRDGSLFPIELAVTEIHIHGKRLFNGIVRDISARKAADKAKDEFVATVSHELRTPLTAIRGSLGLLTGGAAGELPPQASSLLKLAHNNSEHLLLLINDLLDMDTITSGKMEFHFETLAVIPFVEEALVDNSAYTEQNGVNYIMTRRVGTVYVQGDKERLMQVMANLLSNACKFSPTGSTIEIGVSRHNAQIRISVSDHGLGIPKAFHPKLFEKFTQADASDTRQVGGTGLGLCISKAIVEKHNGQIGFTTQLGNGTTFYVDLPEADPPPRP